MYDIDSVISRFKYFISFIVIRKEINELFIYSIWTLSKTNIFL